MKLPKYLLTCNSEQQKFSFMNFGIYKKQERIVQIIMELGCVGGSRVEGSPYKYCITQAHLYKFLPLGRSRERLSSGMGKGTKDTRLPSCSFLFLFSILQTRIKNCGCFVWLFVSNIPNTRRINLLPISFTKSI